jgi:hypothetical protein
VWGKAFEACIRLVRLVNLRALSPFFAYAAKSMGRLAERKKRKELGKVPRNASWHLFTWQMHSKD